MQATGLQGSPLSIQQARLWSWQRHNTVYRTVCAVQIQGLLDREVFRTGLQHVVERHEILRTLFYFLPGMDVPVQIISDDTLQPCPEINLAYLDASDQSRKIKES